jgi:hypothetical protein
LALVPDDAGKVVAAVAAQVLFLSVRLTQLFTN